MGYKEMNGILEGFMAMCYRMIHLFLSLQSFHMKSILYKHQEVKTFSNRVDSS